MWWQGEKQKKTTAVGVKRRVSPSMFLKHLFATLETGGHDRLFFVFYGILSLARKCIRQKLGRLKSRYLWIVQILGFLLYTVFYI